MIMLDTSVLLEMPAVELPHEPMAMSVISYAELAFGATRPGGKSDQALRREHLAWLESLGLDWLPFDWAAGNGYATVAARVWPTRPAHSRSKDILLAGHAYAIGASLATLNPRDFELVADLVPIVVPPRRD